MSLLAAAFAGVLVLASLAPTKEGAQAELTTRVPLDAAPGAKIRIGWTVDVADGEGARRPCSANGMFVRLLSRTGARATTARAAASRRTDGRYTADVTVPAGGIGGVRAGLHGSTSILFPVRKDPFTSPSGVRCDVALVRGTLAAFVRAYNRGGLRRLDALFSRNRFVWYSSGRPGARLRGDAQDRDSLLAYFRQRHRRGDRLALAGYRFNGFDRPRDLGHFELTLQRRARGFRGGRWFRVGGKGALDCSRRPVTIAVLSLGGPEQ